MSNINILVTHADSKGKQYATAVNIRHMLGLSIFCGNTRGRSSFTLTRVWRSWGNPGVYISTGIVYLPVNPRTHSCSLKNVLQVSSYG